MLIQYAAHRARAGRVELAARLYQYLIVCIAVVILRSAPLKLNAF